MKPKNRVFCPDCGRHKMLFESESKAKTFIKFNWEELTDDPDKLRIYWCTVCCGYHISSHQKPKFDRTKEVIEHFNNDFSDNIKCRDLAKEYAITYSELGCSDFRKIVASEHQN